VYWSKYVYNGSHSPNLVHSSEAQWPSTDPEMWVKKSLAIVGAVRRMLVYNTRIQPNMNVKQAICAPAMGLALLLSGAGYGAEGTIELSVTNGNKQLKLPLVSGVDAFRVLRTPSLNTPFAPAQSGSISGYLWTQPGADGLEFFRVEMQPKDP